MASVRFRLTQVLPRPRALVALLLMSCATADPKGDGSGDEDTDTADSADSAVPPRDDDADGYVRVEDGGDDCDDTRADVHPNATEVWNVVDDDCDGRIDADGHYDGEAALSASAIFEGNVHSFALACPASLDRQQGALELTVLCSPDKSDDWAMLLLGGTLTLSVSDAVDGPQWSGHVEVVSSNGWDTRAQGTLDWVDFDTVDLAASLDAVSLDFTASSRLQHTPKRGAR